MAKKIPTTTIDGIKYREGTHLYAVLVRALVAIEQHDEKLNGTAPGYDDAKAPDGDDYNTVVSEALHALRIIRGET